MSILEALGVHQARLGEVCRRYGVARLLVFGSVARGSASPTSDVDVLYELVAGRRLGWEVEDLTDDLADIFGRPVDLVSVTALHHRLKSAVLAEAHPLYAT
jgi:predicted nucleotidyltransferase